MINRRPRLHTQAEIRTPFKDAANFAHDKGVDAANYAHDKGVQAADAVSDAAARSTNYALDRADDVKKGVKDAAGIRR